jgi:class 3 adenylate cyclase
VDIEGFGSRNRTHPDQTAVREGLNSAMERAFRQSGVSYEDCYREDRGDGLFVLIDSTVPKNRLVTRLLDKLAEAIHEHNKIPKPQSRFRVRIAVHAGEVVFDRHGVTGTSLINAFRLLEAAELEMPRVW